eukprot:2657725-Amphidinium_carterae.1
MAWAAESCVASYRRLHELGLAWADICRCPRTFHLCIHLAHAPHRIRHLEGIGQFHSSLDAFCWTTPTL